MTTTSIAADVASRSRFVGSAKVISGLTLISRVLGLVRDMLSGYVFGAGSVMSAFSIGFQIPNLFRRLFGEGALSASSIPILSEQLHRGGPEAVDRLAGRLLGSLLLVLGGLTVLGELVVLVLRPLLVNTERDVLTFGLTALLLPYMVPICAAAILGGIQNVLGQFAVPAANPVVLNLFMIAALLAARPLFGADREAQVYLLAVSVLVSGAFQLAWQWRSARRCGLRLGLAIDTGDEALRRIARAMVPMTVGLGVVQLNALVDQVMAYGLIRSHEGGPAVLYFAQRLYQFPLGVFAIAVATAIFPALSRHAAAGDQEAMAQDLSRGLRLVLFEGLPCSVGLILVREPLIEALLQRGAFDATATDRVARTLIAYSAGIWAFGLNQVSVRGFYAAGDRLTPLRLAAWMVGLNFVLNLALVVLLEEAGLALSTTICAAIQVAWLFRVMSRKVGRLPWRPIAVSAIRTAALTAVMAAVVVAADRFLWTEWPVYARSSLLRLTVMCTLGAAAYVAAAVLLRCPELREVVRGR